MRGVRRGLGPLVRRLQQHRLLQPGAPEEGDLMLREDFVIRASDDYSAKIYYYGLSWLKALPHLRHYAEQTLVCSKCESGSSCFQPGEGTSGCLLHDCETRL